ncbi:MAG TPA: lysylphosphatidylglycerol synthase transmembrane domain-containing protein [Solirubrobacteraceae bacterium]
MNVTGRDLRRRLATAVVLTVCVVTVLLAVPDLRPVVHEITHMDPALVAAAVVFELASCLGFVVIFRLFFKEIPNPASRELAWTQMGSGALLPGGGVGSLAVGGWLLHLAGMPTRQILKRSSGLFFLTSAINVLTLIAASLLLLLGVMQGPGDLLRAGVPVLVAAGAVILVLGLPRITRSVAATHPRMAWLADLGAGIPDARAALVRPNWRLAGGVGYLLFDIAVLWIAFGAVGPLPPLAPLIVAYLLGYLANAIPIPGGIGVLDAGLVGALAIYRLPLAHAAAAVLVYHAIAFWIPALGGIVGYGRLRPRLAAVDDRTAGRADAAEPSAPERFQPRRRIRSRRPSRAADTSRSSARARLTGRAHSGGRAPLPDR